MGGCSTYQIRKIYAIGQALGIVNRGGEDALHDLVYGVTGKSSVKELSYSEACKVIGELEARQGTPPPRPKKTNHRKRKPGGVSEGQERKVWALMYRLAAASPSTVAVGDRLRAAIKKEAGVDAFADDPFAWLDYKSCNKLIEALKGYVKNAERKARERHGRYRSYPSDGRQRREIIGVALRRLQQCRFKGSCRLWHYRSACPCLLPLCRSRIYRCPDVIPQP